MVLSNLKYHMYIHTLYIYIIILYKQSLASVHIPSTLEPRGLCSSSECYSDRLTIFPWSQGKCLAWDVTCHDSLPAQLAPDTYSELATMYALVLIAIETTNIYDDDALDVLRHLVGK